MDARTTMHSRRNILMSSSRQWNPGDEFILLGVRRLLETLLDGPLNYLLWNRNPDLFVDRWRNPQFRPGFLTNSVLEPSLDLVDLIVLAGTPEWFGPPVERIFRELLRYPNVPLIALGVGGTGPGFKFSPLESEIFHRENSLILCRNQTLADDINEQIGPGKAIVLPCPAFFCAEWDETRSLDSFARGLPTINVQGDTVENQSAPTWFVDQLSQIVAEISERSNIRFVAHYIDEFYRFSRLFRDADIFHSYEPLDYLTFYRERPRALLTSRLHGAIASLSCGTPACLVDLGSDRVNDAARPFGDLLPCLPLEAGLQWLEQRSPEQCVQDSNAIFSFKRSTRQHYITALAEFMSRYLSLKNPVEVAR